MLELGAALDRGGESNGVVRGDAGEVGPSGGARQGGDVAMRRGAEADRRIEKLAAEAQAEGHRTRTIQSPST